MFTEEERIALTPEVQGVTTQDKYDGKWIARSSYKSDWL